MGTRKFKSKRDASVAFAVAESARSFHFFDYLNRTSLFMLACCTVMAAGAGFLLATAPSAQSLADALLLAVPLLGCLGMHLVMQRFMGKSCQSLAKKETRND
jgi:type II secretory pathway component PulF